MKKTSALFILTILCLLACFSAAAADGNRVTFYPTVPQQNNRQQQSYPVPQYYPNTQQKPYNNPGSGQPQTAQPYTYDPNSGYFSPFLREPGPQMNQPYYDPISGLYFYPINNAPNPGPVAPQPVQPQPYQPQPYYPSYPYGQYNQNGQAQVSKQWNGDGSVNLTWTIRNVTAEDWARSNVDIKCISGCHLLKDQGRILWDLPYTVNRNGMLSFTVIIWNPVYGESMTFAMVAGSKTLYTFTVYPN